MMISKQHETRKYFSINLSTKIHLTKKNQPSIHTIIFECSITSNHMSAGESLFGNVARESFQTFI